MDFSRLEGIDVEVQIVFRADHLRLLMPYFKQAGIQPSDIDKIIDEHISTGEIVPFERWFLECGQNRLNPSMNRFLKREPSHPTFNKLLKVALKEQIERDPTILQLRRFSKKV